MLKVRLLCWVCEVTLRFKLLSGFLAFAFSFGCCVLSNCDQSEFIPAPTVEPVGACDSSFHRTSLSNAYKESAEYRAKRDRNNIASQKSRLKRQNKFKMLKEEEVELKRKNAELVARVSSLERQVQDIKDIIMKAIAT
ncbi:unnamed protein product [Enterobius vermicularis]|uniref:BZIP domain-containing protein n=1 Tax=Enterobius vermicularis TaxID=51028 RepID=A0A3P6IP69_ENTVE|nr:unnamed protein product [Enterobius vermicularis]